MNRLFNIIIWAVLFVGCNKAELVPLHTNDIDNLIIGTWQWGYTVVYDDPDNPTLGRTEVAEEDDVIREIFKQDGTYVLEVYIVEDEVLEIDFGLEGRYELSNGKDVLSIIINGLGTSQHKIIELTEDTFAYEEIDDDGIRSVHYYFRVTGE